MENNALAAHRPSDQLAVAVEPVGDEGSRFAGHIQDVHLHESDPARILHLVLTPELGANGPRLVVEGQDDRDGR